jgi:hypothetical protein
MTDPLTDERLATIARDVAPVKFIRNDAEGVYFAAVPVLDNFHANDGHVCNLPALRAALEQQRKEGARAEAERIAEMLDRFAADERETAAVRFEFTQLAMMIRRYHDR